MPKHFFYLKIIRLWDNTAKRSIQRHRAHWDVLLLGCSWLFVLHTRLNRAFRSAFRFVSDNIPDNFCIVCTQTAFFIKKQKALGDFRIILKIILASFVPSLKGAGQLRLRSFLSRVTVSKQPLGATSTRQGGVLRTIQRCQRISPVYRRTLQSHPCFFFGVALEDAALALHAF